MFRTTCLLLLVLLFPLTAVGGGGANFGDGPGDPRSIELGWVEGGTSVTFAVEGACTVAFHADPGSEEPLARIAGLKSRVVTKVVTVRKEDKGESFTLIAHMNTGEIPCRATFNEN